VAATPAAAPAAAKPPKKFDSSEDFLSDLSSRLSDAEKTTYKQNIKDVSKTLPHDMTAAQWRDLKTKMDQERIRIMTRLLGSRVEKLDKKQIQAVCQALGGTVEGHPNLCK
jgi:phosphoenolpyruvate-protein kinase (PTS system EI component)